jgi:hypothetical protein
MMNLFAKLLYIHASVVFDVHVYLQIVEYSILLNRAILDFSTQEKTWFV